MLYTENVIKDFNKNNKGRTLRTKDPIFKQVNPQKIIAINNTYTYPDILKDFKMKRLEKSILNNGWDNSIRKAIDLDLLELPNGDLLVSGNGNHRAVLAKNFNISSIVAHVYIVEYLD